MSPELFQPTHTQEWLITVIKLSGVQFDLKSYAWFKNWTKAQRGELDLKPQVQLPLYYSHFEIAEFTEFSQYNYFIDVVADLVENGKQNCFTSHFFYETEMMWCESKNGAI